MSSIDPIIAPSRVEALEQGLKRYFTGKPCLRGHLAPRSVRDRQCIECRYILSGRGKPPRIPASSGGELTIDEINILQQLADGETTAKNDLKGFIRSIMIKLGARTINNAVATGVRRGIID